MLKTIFLASAMTLALSAAAGAQQPPASPSPAPAQTQQAPSTGAPTITVVNIVDVEQLPPETKTQVDQYVAKQGNDGLQKLRQSIDSTPEAKSALQQKGMTSRQVVAASLDDNGTLTLITKKKAS
jgi:ABC-type transport system substrate-binding protein